VLATAVKRVGLFTALKCADAVPTLLKFTKTTPLTAPAPLNLS
jgi:hypothetical protein